MKKLAIVLLMPIVALFAQSNDTLSITFSDVVVEREGESFQFSNVVVKVFSEKVENIADLLQYDMLQLIDDRLKNKENNEMTTLVLLEDDLEPYRKLKTSRVEVEEEPMEVKIRIDEERVEDVEVEGNEWEEELEEMIEERIDREVTVIEKSRHTQKRNDNSTNLYFGINTYRASDGQPLPTELAVKSIGSWYVAINNINKTRIAHPLYIEWGVGISWYNFKFDDPDQLWVKNTTDVVTEPIATTREGAIKSKLVNSHLDLSFVPMIDFGGFQGEKFRIGAGVYGGYRINSYTKQVFRVGGDKDKVRDWENFYLNDWRYGVTARIGWKGVDLFANYDLNQMFQDGRGPELNAIAFGIIL